MIGNLGDEPVIRKTSNGNSVANFSMVTNELRRNTQTGESTEFAEWHRIVLWNRLAEVAEQYMHKGSRIYLEGKIRNRSYVDKNNQKKYVTEIQADELLLLDARQDSTESAVPARPYANPAPVPQAESGYGSNPYPNNAYEQAAPQPNAFAPNNYQRQPSPAAPAPQPQREVQPQQDAPLTEPNTLMDEQIPF
ncbi:MAG: single-stranded DNA-binding protein [Succinivibrio sp.]|nr:single-stranded DNA-binding protein [Succinivibrio sp.]